MPYTKLYYHFLWSTHKRYPWIEPEIERQVYRIIVAECERFSAQIHGINGMPDHIHLVLGLRPAKSISDFLNGIKGTSSRICTEKFPDSNGWSSGYGGFTIGPQGLPIALDYVRYQKRHHAENTLIDALEYMSDDHEYPPVKPFDLDAFLDDHPT